MEIIVLMLYQTMREAQPPNCWQQVNCESLSAPVACQESPTPAQADPLMGCCVFFVVVVDC